MGERVTYAQRIMQAVNNPQEFLSTISDGMVQLFYIKIWFTFTYTRYGAESLQATVAR